MKRKILNITLTLSIITVAIVASAFMIKNKTEPTSDQNKQMTDTFTYLFFTEPSLVLWVMQCSYFFTVLSITRPSVSTGPLLKDKIRTESHNPVSNIG